MIAGAPVLWDIPTRVIHWMIVVCLPLSWWSAQEQRYDLHKWLGYTVLVLVIVRVLWGFIGSRHSRFSDFLVGPSAVWAYLRGRGAASVGHNPLGGWSVVLLLSLLALQSISGLFNTDDILFSGPFYYWASTELRDTMGVVHQWAFDGLLALVSLHVLAVCYHQFLRREKLVQAMVAGRADGRAGKLAPAPWWWAVLLAGAVALVLWWLIERAPGPVYLGF
ncbi:MAG: cytochrome b/b6 domain-containing protein [Halioglobus sp.]|nr:cytochrome b/b6 domain-containing protein [Halioglobus sp.]